MDFLITLTPKDLSSYPLHRHDTYEIICYLEGRGVMRTENEDIPFEAGTILIVPPHFMHGSQSEDRFANICVHVSNFPKICKHEILIGQDSSEKDARTLARLLYRLYLDENTRKGELIGHIYDAYLSLVLWLLNKNESDVIFRLYRELTNNIDNSLFDVQETISGLGYSEDYIRRLFRTRYQKTPLQYLIHARIDYAQSLLSVYNDEFTIGEIAQMCGFSDPLYFSRIFKQTTGVSPKEFVKRKLKPQS